MVVSTSSIPGDHLPAASPEIIVHMYLLLLTTKLGGENAFLKLCSHGHCKAN